MPQNNESSLGSVVKNIEYVWEPLPHDSLLREEFVEVQLARVSEEDQDDTCSKCKHDSFSKTTFNPLNLRKKTGEIVSYNELTTKQKMLADSTRSTVRLCLTHILEGSDEWNEIMN